jgi:hypothetical protein
MEQPTDGAVAHYGATGLSNVGLTQVLERRLFEAVYTQGLIRQGQAVSWAEDQLGTDCYSTVLRLRYMLLGDPAMVIRRRQPIQLDITVPGYLVREATDRIEVKVYDGQDDPLPVEGALVGLWKPGDGDESDVWVNAYTDSQGSVDIPVSMETPGWLYYTVQDEGGETVMDSIRVLNESAVDENEEVAELSLAVRPGLGDAPVSLLLNRSLSQPARIKILNVAGRLVCELLVPAGEQAASWDGTDEVGRPVGSGLYFATMRVGDRKLFARIVFIK